MQNCPLPITMHQIILLEKALKLHFIIPHLNSAFFCHLKLKYLYTRQYGILCPADIKCSSQPPLVENVPLLLVLEQSQSVNEHQTLSGKKLPVDQSHLTPSCRVVLVHTDALLPVQST